MSFKTEIEITPDADGVHCGECRYCNTWCQLFRQSLWAAEPELHWVRCPACLAAEKAWRERNP